MRAISVQFTYVLQLVEFKDNMLGELMQMGNYNVVTVNQLVSIRENKLFILFHSIKEFVLDEFF